MIVRIFVKGDADVKFIKDLVYHLYKITLDNNDIVKTNGWQSIQSGKEKSKLLQNKLIENADGVNLVIFDADADYELRKKEIEKWKNDFELEFKLFLFPNNKDSGELENLLEKLINIKNKPILDCWDGYETCLKKISETRETPLTTPAKKSKIYSYIETLVGKSNSEKEKIKDRNRDFLNTDHWKLESDEIKPLQSFLDEHLKNETK